jgi:hypothetical protein
MTPSQIKIVITALGATSAVLAAAVIGAASTAKKPAPIAFQCGSDNSIQYIIQSGSEYILANPRTDWERNSFLVSTEAPNTPLNWRYYNLLTASSSDKGFSLKANDQKPYISSIAFDAQSGVLATQFGPKSLTPEKTTCKRIATTDDASKGLNNVPVDYLLLRNKLIPFLNPGLGNKEFNIKLHDALDGKDHSEYSTYKLLASLNVNDITGDQRLEMEAAREKAIEANSSSTSVWEHDGTYTYWWEFANEKGEASKHAAEWCRSQQFESTSDYTSQGFKIISSEAEQTTGDWQTHLYPDGRFAGYVKFKATCNGQRYQLKKEGTIDAEAINTWRGD